MIIQCSHCSTRYEYDEDRFERKPSKKIRCARCKEVFEIRNPAFDEPKKPAPSGTDETAVRKPSRPATQPDEDEGTGTAKGTAPSAAPLHLPEDRRYSIAIIEGPEAATVFRIEKPRVIVGRSNADIVINDTESSREHAAVEIRGTMVTIEDLGSKNGTWVDGEKIEGTVEIFNQGEFRIGGSLLMLIETEND